MVRFSRNGVESMTQIKLGRGTRAVGRFGGFTELFCEYVSPLPKDLVPFNSLQEPGAV